MAATLGQEQDLCFQFRDRLQKAPLISKVFKDIQISVTGKPMSLDATEGLEPAQLTKKLEQRTVFRIQARGKKL